ncbi:hypothetical protein [Vibrio scophthalmi]|uniref:hypothetical protein n=1 Tax=Vibrio scophthalmi TaxID=45658 RepID=UPI0012E9948A|nr:hypothetical protein [Vibrio scophthalmi]
MYNGLLSTQGRNFISENIWLKSESYTLLKDNPVESITRIGIRGRHTTFCEHSHQYGYEDVFYFYFVFDNRFNFKNIESGSDENTDVEEAFFKNECLVNAWGIHTVSYDDDGYFTEQYETHQINSFKLRFQLLHLKIKFYFRTLMQEKYSFDLTLPLVFNSILLISWMILITLGLR